MSSVARPNYNSYMPSLAFCMYINEIPEQPINFYTMSTLNNKKNIDKIVKILLNTQFFNSS
jgi:hypothetical protein